MKLHEREGISGFGWRMAVPGGWLYDNGCAAFGFVPDPTAEHVTESAANVAAVVGAKAGYAKAIADCWEMLDSELKEDSASPAYRMKLLSKFKALAASNATSQTGEG